MSEWVGGGWVSGWWVVYLGRGERVGESDGW